jgi:mRNA-degrading endonuclease RelE of RelBE toxin-antitoxin system
MKINLEIEQQVLDFIRALPPEPRLAIRRALKKLAAGQGDVRPLQEELSGFHRLRVKSYRIIFHRPDKKTLRCVFAESRNVVYALYAELLSGD